jgi:hypothetical protein
VKWSLCTIVLVLGLAACSQPLVSPTPAPESTTEPTATSHAAQEEATPTHTVSERPGGVFDVYLVQDDISVGEMMDADVAQLQLEETPLLSIENLVAYHWDTHGMELTPSGAERLARLEPSLLGGLPFVLCAGGEPIYGGALWTSYSSATYPGIVIDVYPASLGQPVPIRLGYPTPEWFTGEDLRSDARIYQELEEAGELK